MGGGVVPAAARDSGFIRRFVIYFGPLSSVFGFVASSAAIRARR